MPFSLRIRTRSLRSAARTRGGRRRRRACAGRRAGPGSARCGPGGSSRRWRTASDEVLAVTVEQAGKHRTPAPPARLGRAGRRRCHRHSTLRLPSVRNEFPETADRAMKDPMTYRGFRAELPVAHYDDRARRCSERQIKAAGFPREKSLRPSGFDAAPATVRTPASCGWIKKSQPLRLNGDCGTGKSHMLIVLGTEAATKSHRVRCTLAAKPVNKRVNKLVEAADEKQLNNTTARCGPADLLCIDEPGHTELDRHGTELPFRFWPSGRRRTASPSPRTHPTAAGPRPSPARSSARRSRTVSPPTAPSPRPGPTHTALPAPEHGPKGLPGPAGSSGPVIAVADGFCRVTLPAGALLVPVRTCQPGRSMT